MRLNYIALTAFVLAVASCAFADVYIQNMRGSNNRNDEDTTPRQNANRLFDSQNNNNGGYHRGDNRMYYYEGSTAMLTWTNQHACGTNENTNCQLVVQYMCGPNVRDGTNTNTPGTQNDDPSTGLHESRQYYADCSTRKRNQGLFTADQNLNGNTAIYTRQNPGGTRRGLECPEERDYYPYWHPSPWKDIVVMTSNTSRCAYYQAESQNVKAKGYCSNAAHNNPATCTAAGATWQEQAPFNIPAPECILAPWSRDNHLGNGELPFENSYNWTIPSVAAAVDGQKCVLRIRYNISTNDYPWSLNASFNGRAKSPVKQNPVIDFGINEGLRLAINTAQYGRTFQDRTHTFEIKPRPNSIPVQANIYNVNVRGKRGNIVQVYPAVEYDFVPTQLSITTNDYVHWQWVGSDNNPRGNDGQGTAGTDRSNIVQIRDNSQNWPLRASNVTMFASQSDIRKFATVGGTNQLLNDAPAYFDGGLYKPTTTGTFHYMCTRNNNFSNRSQKAVLRVQ